MRKTWVDITAELEIAEYESGDLAGAHLNRDGKCFIPCPAGYRFRKVLIGEGADTAAPVALVLEQLK